MRSQQGEPACLIGPAHLHMNSPFILKCTGGQIKAFGFLLCPAKDTKYTKGGERWYTEWLQNNEQQEQTHPVCLHVVEK